MKIMLAALFLLSAVLPVQAGHSADHVCQIATEQQFYDTVSAKNATIMVANNKARDMIMEKVNKNRKANGLFLIEVEKFVIGIFEEGSNVYVGTVGFTEKCVVPGTVAVVPASQWVSFTVSIGVNSDDFSRMVDG